MKLEGRLRAAARRLATKRLGEALAAIATVWNKPTRVPKGLTPGLMLARAVQEYFGDDDIDPSLTSDIALRELADAIVMQAPYA